jgi:hypothetical protein
MLRTGRSIAFAVLCVVPLGIPGCGRSKDSAEPNELTFACENSADAAKDLNKVLNEYQSDRAAAQTDLQTMITDLGSALSNANDDALYSAVNSAKTAAQSAKNQLAQIRRPTSAH